MPEKVVVGESEFLEGSDIWTLARVVGADNSTITQSIANGTPNWNLDVYDESGQTPTVVMYGTTGAASDLLFNTLQPAGTYWTADQYGYNMRHQLTNAALELNLTPTTGNHTYRLEYVLNTSLWGPIPVLHFATCRARKKV